jgi:hypothetical protein
LVTSINVAIARSTQAPVPAWHTLAAIENVLLSMRAPGSMPMSGRKKIVV